MITGHDVIEVKTNRQYGAPEKPIGEQVLPDHRQIRESPRRPQEFQRREDGKPANK
jgi:hypothetical protein